MTTVCVTVALDTPSRGSAAARASSAAKNSGAKVMLIKPGPAISTLLHTLDKSASSSTSCAISRGVLPNCLASANDPLT